jgi:spermidine synthase
MAGSDTLEGASGWVQLDVGHVPGETELLQLMRRGDQFSITIGTIELMGNRAHGSEIALANLACARLTGRARPRVLIGGLGMGYTLRAALAALPTDAEIVVAELVAAVARWARGPLAHMFADSLDDPRLALRVEDVGRTIRAGAAQYDAILLDVDNGPEGTTRRENDLLYGREGLQSVHRALRSGGLLAVWSMGPDRRFKARLRGSGFAVEERRVPAHGTAGRQHVIWLAERSSARDRGVGSR